MEVLSSNEGEGFVPPQLNTIENADEIFFVNDGEILAAGSFQEALDLLMRGKVAS
ncbi:MAG: hypothetical protein R2751_07010 [Bacteroidales bacterium]